MTYKIDRYDIFHLDVLNRDTYTINTIDNKCPDIKIGDIVIIEGVEYEVENLEWFMKSFGIKGDNVTLLLKDNDYII